MKSLNKSPGGIDREEIDFLVDKIVMQLKFVESAKSSGVKSNTD